MAQAQQFSPQMSAPSTGQPGAAVAESPQPTVRVMRLYQPVMYFSPPVPQVRVPENINNAANFNSESDFALSNCLLLPDSFGDIYLGEKFSAYVSVVNGTQDVEFKGVHLSVKLKSVSTAMELHDIRAIEGQVSGRSELLRNAEFSDMVVERVLNTMGTHSLRVMVEYIDPLNGEPRALVKNYKFNVLNPILISSNVMDLGNKYVVQSQITNCTRSLIHIEEVSMQCQRDLIVTKTVPNITDADVAKFAFMASLGPDEKYAESFILEKPVGFLSATIGVVGVKWSTTMGEHGYIRGDELMAPIAANSAVAAPKEEGETHQTKITQTSATALTSFCVACPDAAFTEEEFTITLRIFNNSYTSSANLAIRVFEPPVHDYDLVQGLVIVGKTSWNEGLLQARSYVDIILHVVAISSGLHEFGGLYIRDSISNSEVLYGASIAKIYVSERTSWYSDGPSSISTTVLDAVL